MISDKFRIIGEYGAAGLYEEPDRSLFYRKSLEIRRFYENCDLVLFDIKETNEEKHKQFTGVSLQPILKNLDIVNKTGSPFIVRLPIIPGLNNNEEHFCKVKNIIKNMKYCQGVEIMPYHSLGMYKYELLQREYLCSDINEPDNETISKWKKFFYE